MTRARSVGIAQRSVLLLALALACAAGVEVPGARAGTTAYRQTLALHSPPQRAVGDFDGDGRSDVAFIQSRGAASHVSLALSASSQVVELDEPVTGLVESDIDSDGDLDLVAATATGEVVIWLNDGHGRFTRQAPAPRGDLSGNDPTVARGVPDCPAALGGGAESDANVQHQYEPCASERARPPTAVRSYFTALIRLSPRAPPALHAVRA